MPLSLDAVGVARDGAELAPFAAELMAQGRFDEALARLYEEAERRPTDRGLKLAIEEVRERMADAMLASLGSPNAAPRATGEQRAEGLGPDEDYLMARIDGSRTLGDLVRTSTLGR